MEKEFGKNLSTVLSLMATLVSLVTAMSSGGQMQAYALAVAIVGGVALLVLVYHRVVRRKRYKRSIGHRGDKEQATGFIGAISYSRTDAVRFFGRDADIDAICAQLQQESYCVLHGESGVGKTSLIQAGLIPRLEANHQCAYLSMAHLPREIKGAETERLSVDALLSFVAQRVGRKLAIPKYCKEFKDLCSSLHDLKCDSTILFLDQFEQIFDLTDEQTRRVFLQTLVKYCGGLEARLKVVLSVRADYFGLVYHMFDVERSHVYLLEKLPAPQARQIIRCSSGFDEKLHEANPEHFLLAFEDELLADLRDSNGRIHPVEISLICWMMLKAVGQLSKANYLEGGRKQGWLDRYLDDVLQALPDKSKALQVLNSMIDGDKSIALTAGDIALRAGLELEATNRLLRDLEKSKMVVSEAMENEFV